MSSRAVIQGKHAPIHLWTQESSVDLETLKQLRNTASLPFVFKHVAVMPDVHLGKGATVGSVMATKGAICPAAVGVDIGCGMSAVLTDLDARIVQDQIGQVRGHIEGKIPVGFHGNREVLPRVDEWIGWKKWKDLSWTDRDLKQRAMSQLGSLGGGNHFIEICLDTQNRVWILLHSGSRNIGKTLAERHIQEAKAYLKQLALRVPDTDLSYFRESTEQFRNYWTDLQWCQEYALQNRREMMDRILEILSAIFFENTKPVEQLRRIDCHHNYVAQEQHFGEWVFVTRKGAVRARQGDWGIIPGSMGTRSYIVRGRGSEESFHSCSHGAGRRMSRTKAREHFKIHDLIRQTEGVECRKDSGVIDEIPAAYKDIEEVIRNQDDLIEVDTELKQILCIKG